MELEICNKLFLELSQFTTATTRKETEILAANKILFAEVEQLRVQLAGCGVAAMCNTEKSREQQKCVEGDYGWSQSYQDVLNAVAREIELRDENIMLLDAIQRMLDSPALISEIANEILLAKSV